MMGASPRGYSQYSNGENEGYTQLRLPLHLQFPDNRMRKNQNQEVGYDVDRGR